MKDRLTSSAAEMNGMERCAADERAAHRPDPRAAIIVTALFLTAALSLPSVDAAGTLLFFIYPVAECSLEGISYGRIARRSTAVLPIVILIGLFNPLLDRTAVFELYGLTVTRGWLSFAVIVMRGLLSVQAALILISSVGFDRFCRNLHRLGMPSVLTTELMFVYRYIFVLADEASSMKRAREARSFGRRGFGLRIWGATVGELFIRSSQRAERVGLAMKARGFDGEIRTSVPETAWRTADTHYLVCWAAALAAMRFLPQILF